MAAKQKILIIDDDNNIAELISLYLTKECFETKIVNDGEQALKEFQTFQPDLLLLDTSYWRFSHAFCHSARSPAKRPPVHRTLRISGP